MENINEDGGGGFETTDINRFITIEDWWKRNSLLEILDATRKVLCKQGQMKLENIGPVMDFNGSFLQSAM